MRQDSLQARGVSVEFAGLRALDGVSLEVVPGEILGLIGPNGSGKTTLVNALTGQVPIVSGDVVCAGETITGEIPRKIALLGIARSFQIVRLFGNLTVRENVETAALAKGLPRREADARAEELLDEFHLNQSADTLGDALNYGDKRRVEIARALASEPRFLLLDEPAAGMNETESDTLLDMLAMLPEKRNCGMLIIDHDMPLIMRLCHRLHVLASGRTIAEGDIDTVRQHPAVIEAYLGSDAKAADHHA
ncbi:MAG: ABC transporter ATP-binding protein [Hyphomicrobiaceae bacterium]|nr:ABC transporter ATP-binding protein [Hyphomicrobiaceae bacterium]